VRVNVVGNIRAEDLAKLGEKLDIKPRSAAEKVRLAAAMKTLTSVSNGWLAERLRLGAPASRRKEPGELNQQIGHGFAPEDSARGTASTAPSASRRSRKVA